MPQSQRSEVGEPLQVVRNGRAHLQEYGGIHDAGDNLDITYDATEQITAGNLVELTASGVQNHGTAEAAVHRTLVAVDARMFGMEAGGTYNQGETVFLVEANGGGLWMRLAAGEAVTRDSALVSAGDGTLQAQGTGSGAAPDSAVVCVPVQPVDNGNGSSPMWVPVAGFS